MKQSFTLKAVALGLAAVATLGAAAVRPQMPTEFSSVKSSRISFNTKSIPSPKAHTVKTATPEYSVMASHKIRPAIQELDITTPVSRIDPYGPWADAGTMEYTYNVLFEGEASITKSYPYQKRTNPQNPDNFQIKVANWGAMTAEEVGMDIPGCELILTVTPAKTTTGKTLGVVTTAATGISLGWDTEFSFKDGSKLDVPMYYFDHYSWALAATKLDPEYMSAENAATWYGSSIYDYTTGQFELMPMYSGASTDVKQLSCYFTFYKLNADGTDIEDYIYDYIQLSGKFYNYEANIDVNAGYFYRNAGETGGYFKAPFEINDNALGVVKILKGAISSEADLNAAFNAMIANINNPTPDMAVLETPKGWINLAVSDYADGQYTILFGVAKEIAADGSADIDGSYKTTYLEGAEFVLDGFAKYSDAFVTGFVGGFVDENKNPLTPEQLGLTSNYSTTCQVEKSEKEAGIYRLRAPYAQYKVVGQFGYMQQLDYLYYDISNPEKAFVEPSMLGIYLTLGSGTNAKVYIMGGTSLNAFTFPNVNADDFLGTYADNKLTFPNKNQEISFTEEGEMYTETIGTVMALMYDRATGKLIGYNVSTNPTDFLIETGVVDAIENVEASADVNAPVEYYNLQGQKVVNPAAGQLVIKKQGSKVTKMIAQ